MEASVFGRCLIVQAVAVFSLFALLVALPLPSGFFESWGWLTGPAAWLACSFLTGRLLGLSPPIVLSAAAAAGVAGALAFVAGSHTAGLVTGLVVFAAGCAALVGRLAA